MKATNLFSLYKKCFMELLECEEVDLKSIFEWEYVEIKITIS